MGASVTVNVDDLFDTRNDGTFVLRVHVQPGAGRSSVVGRHGGSLKVRIATPPVDGRANVACAELLAEELGLTSAQVEVVGGATSRSKEVAVTGIEPEELRQHLRRLVTPPARRERTGTRGDEAKRGPR